MNIDKLIEAVQALKGEDRNIDRLIGIHTGIAVEVEAFGMAGNYYMQYREGGYNGLVTSPDYYTSSVDSALRLLHKLCPDYTAYLIGPRFATITVKDKVYESSYALTPATSLCVAILRAYQGGTK